MQGIGGRGNINGFIPLAAGGEVFRVTLGKQMRFAPAYLVDDDLEVVLDDEQVLLRQSPHDREDVAQIPLADALLVEVENEQHDVALDVEERGLEGIVDHGLVVYHVADQALLDLQVAADELLQAGGFQVHSRLAEVGRGV